MQYPYDQLKAAILKDVRLETKVAFYKGLAMGIVGGSGVTLIACSLYLYFTS